MRERGSNRAADSPDRLPDSPDRLPGSPRHLRRAIAAAVAGATLAGLAAVAVELGVGTGAGAPPAVDAPKLRQDTTLERPAPPSAGPRPGHPAMAGPGWRVVSVNSISGVLMVTVETERVDETVVIAREVVAPARAQLLEALVYFRRPGASGAASRVQWTPDGGYVPLRFAE